MTKAKIPLFFLLTFFFWAWAKEARAVMYYIDFENGNDSNSGLSVLAPWKHSPGDDNAVGVSNALTPAPGDIFLFKGGVVYKGMVSIKSSGTAGNVIAYDGNSEENWGIGKAIIDGEGKELGINARKRGFYSNAQSSIGKSHILIDNFEIRNLRYIYEDNPDDQPRGVFFDGRGSGIEIRNCNIHDVKKKSVAIDTEQGAISVTVDTLTDSSQDFTAYAGTPGLLATHTIKTSWLINGVKSDYYQANAYIGELDGDSTTIRVYKDIYLTQPGWNYGNFDPLGENNSGYFYYVYNMQKGFYRGSGGLGISVLAHSDVDIHHNIVKQAKGGINVSASRGQAARNVNIFNNDISFTSWGINPTAGGYANEHLIDLEIHDNTIHDFRDFTEYDWGYHQDGVFLFNAGPTNDAYINGVKFYNNFFYGYIGPATALLYMSGNVSDVVIYNNLFASSAGGGYAIRTIGNSSEEIPSVKNIKIYNNNFAKIPGEEKYSLAFRKTSNITLRNNVFYLYDQLGACFALENSAIQGFSSDYNLLHGARIYKGEISYGGMTYDIENWITADQSFPHDQHSVARQNPLFKKFPAFAAKTNASGSVSRIYYAANTNPNYTHVFNIGDNVEYMYDRVMRSVTNVGSGFIDISPPLERASKSGEIVLNWKTFTSVSYDLSVRENSPLINAGIDLSSEISNLDLAGISRPQGSWDIGAFEYVSGTDITAPITPQGLIVR